MCLEMPCNPFDKLIMTGGIELDLFPVLGDGSDRFQSFIRSVIRLLCEDQGAVIRKITEHTVKPLILVFLHAVQIRITNHDHRMIGHERHGIHGTGNGVNIQFFPAVDQMEIKLSVTIGKSHLHDCIDILLFQIVLFTPEKIESSETILLQLFFNITILKRCFVLGHETNLSFLICTQFIIIL